MKKISQKALDKLKASGATVKSNGIPAKPKPIKKPKQSNLAPFLVEAVGQMGERNSKTVVKAVNEVGKNNKEVIESLRKEIKTLSTRKRTPWKFKIERDDEGRLESVLATPVD